MKKMNLAFPGILALCVPSVISAALVFWNIKALGFSYWDEYNYFVTAQWFLGNSGGVFHTYQPPLFPFFISLFFRIFGVRDYVAIATSGFFAVMTVALLTIAGKKMFGIQVAVLAPIFLTITAFFLIFSRVAVTDMTFTFFFTAASLGAFYALRSQRLTDEILAGVLFACSAGVKYSGVFALLVPVAYVLVLVVNAKGQRSRAGFRYLKALLVMIVPTAIGALLFVAFLGVGGSLKDLVSRRGFDELTFGFRLTFQRGFVKFMTLSWGAHASQLHVLPLRSSFYYLQVLTTWGSIPILALAILGLVMISMKKQSEVFTAIWAAVIFLIFSSIEPYAREILPLMPPLSLLAALGFTKTLMTVRTAMPIPKRGNYLLRFRPTAVVSVLILVLVLGLSIMPVFQTISVNHDSYRRAGQILRELAGNGTVLADTQLVMAYYYPVYFGNVSMAELSSAKYLIVDQEAVAHHNEAAIRYLERQHRIELVASIHNDIYDIIYLEVTNFQGLQTWNYTNIEIYRVINVTSTSS